MNKPFLKNFVLLLMILIICSGCEQNNNIIGANFSITQNDPQAVKYKSGTILVKNNEQNDMANQKNFVNPESSIGEIKFGPKNTIFN